MAAYSDKMSARKGKDRKSLSKEQSDALVKEVRDNLDSAYEHERTNIEEAQTDQRMLADDQWPDAARRAREAAGLPVLTFNRLNTFVNQVVNPVRMADKAIKAKPDDNVADATLAKVCDGIFRKIQRDSFAKLVFGKALACQAGCGIGWLRVCHDYNTQKSFDQDIFIEAIDNPLAVFWDSDARGPVREDMMWAGVTEMWTEARFKSRWPKALVVSADDPSSTSLNGFYWRDRDDVRVVEYYKRIPIKKRLAKMADGSVVDLGEAKDDAAMPTEPGMMEQVIQVREVDTYRVEKYMVSGSEVLEGPSEVPGCYIPLVPAMGGETAVERGTYRFGVIRFARDAQRLYNVNRTAMAEWIGQAPAAPWLVTPKMIAQHAGIWNSQNINRRNFIPYTPDEKAPTNKPERISPPEMPVALSNEAMMASEDMKTGTNIHDAALGKKSNETSGIAIERRQMESDVSNYHFSDNFEASLTHLGTIIMEWIPIIYDTPRTIILIGEDGEEQPTPVNMPTMDPQTGMSVIQNDLSKAKFGVQVTIGPSYSTRRIESAQQIGEFMKAIPPAQAALITDIYARNQDWQGHEEIAKRLKATIPPQIVAQAEAPPGPDGKPMPLPPPEPSPFEIAELELKKAQTAKLQADVQVALEGLKSAKVAQEKDLATTAKTIVEARQLDRADSIMDFPGNTPGAQPRRMDEDAARPNYVN